MLQCNISLETMRGSKPNHGYIVYTRKRKASEPDITEEQAEKDPLLVLGTPVKPRMVKVYVKQKSIKDRARSLASLAFGASSETEASHALSTLEATEEKDYSSSERESAYFDTADWVDVKENIFVPLHTVSSCFEHHCREYEQNRNLCTFKEADDMVSLACEESNNVDDNSGSICSDLLGSVAVNNSVLDPHEINGSVVEHLVDSKEDRKACACQKFSNKALDNDARFVVDNEFAEQLNLASSAPKVYHSDMASSSSVNNNTQEHNGNCFFPGDHGFILMKRSPESEEGTKSSESGVTEEDQSRAKEDSQGVKGQEGAKGSKKAPRKQVKKKSHRPRIMVDGRKPRKSTKVSRAKPATLGEQSVSRKRKKEKNNEPDVTVAPETPGKQNLSKRRRNEKKSVHETGFQPGTPFPVESGMSAKKIVGQENSLSAHVVRALKFDQQSQPSEENLVGPLVHLDEHENPISDEFAKTCCAEDSFIPSDTDLVGDPNAALAGDSNEACDQAMDETKTRTKVSRTRLEDQTFYAIETRRLSQRNKCLDASSNLGPNFPKPYKRKRMVRMSRIDFSTFVFEIQSAIQEAIPIDWKRTGKRSKTAMFPVITWKKRSKRSTRLQSISKWDAIPLCNQLPERIPALLGCGERNHSQAEEPPKMISHIQESQTNNAKELHLLCNDRNQLCDADTRTVHSLTNAVIQNGETEGKLLCTLGGKRIEIVHGAQTFLDSATIEASEMWKEMVALPFGLNYQTASSHQNSAVHEYPVNLEQHISDHSVLALQNYDLVQNVGQASCVRLEPYSVVKNVEHEPFLCHEDHQFVRNDFWLTDKGASLEHEGSATKLTAAGDLYQNQLPLTLQLFSGGGPVQHEAAGALYQNRFLNLFPVEVPMPLQDTRLLYENFIGSATYARPIPDMGVLQYGLRNKGTKDINLLIRKMRSLDINERMLDFNAMIKANKKQGKKKQKSIDSERRLMVLNHAAQGPNLLVPHEEPAKRKMKTAKVHLDAETIKEWQLLMMNDLPGGSNADEDREENWEGEREVFRGRVDLFIKRMHLLQADRKFKQWKGSVVDSVVGVFLTQNVSDHLSSNAYISLAAKFPIETMEDHESGQEFVENGTGQSDALVNSQGLPYFVDEPAEEDKNGLKISKLVIEDQGSTHVGSEGCEDLDTTLPEEINSEGIPILSCDEDGRIRHEASNERTACKNQRSSFDNSNNDLKSKFVSVFLVETQNPLGMQETERSMPVEGQGGKAPRLGEQQKTTLRRNKKTGVMEDEKVDWKSLRRMYTEEGPRDKRQMDSVDWDAVRLSEQRALENSIKDRGQQTIIAGRIKEFLNQEVKENETIDLEWLRHAPPDLVKRYLLEINGLGLKSVECIRLLALKHIAFPVDTNVGRIAVRLGWVPLEPFPDEVQLHLLEQYPYMDSIQKYLWPRLCRLPQAVLYELHYQMITFGKVFCTKKSPNCNACPMKAECKHFASAYASAKLHLPSPQGKRTENSDASLVPPNALVETNHISTITSIEENASPECGNQTNCCEPIVDMPPSPTTELPELCEPIVEMPPSPASEIPELIDIEDTPWRTTWCYPNGEIPEIDMDMETFKKNVQDAMLNIRKMLNSYNDEDVSKAVVALRPENACIPLPAPRLKYYSRLRTEHVVYVLPDHHELLKGFERREPDDPSPYLLTVWQPGETPTSFTPPTKKCNSDGSELCNSQTCSYCCSIREQNSNVLRGTILIPCRTAMRGSFPLNGTYFQINEVFADQETSLKPIVFPRHWTRGLEKRALYCGSSVSSIFRGLDTRRIQLCFWTGYVCVRGFHRNKRIPQELAGRLHTPPSRQGKKFERQND